MIMELRLCLVRDRYMFRGLVDHSDGTQSLYYWGQQGTHSRQSADNRGVFGIGRLSMVRDRWVGLGSDVPFATSETNGSAAALHMTTHAVLLPRCLSTAHMLVLTLNAEVSVGGNLSIALLGASPNNTGATGNSGGGVMLPGFGHDDCMPIVGNRLAAPLTFRRAAATVNHTYSSDLQGLTSQTVALEFRLLPPARVFAWRFHCK
jgi:hypothetical protein